MICRYEVDLEYIDMIRYPGESSGPITRTYDLEVENIFEGHDKVRDLVEPEKRNPYCEVKISHPRLLGIVCKHCSGKGVIKP